MKIIVPMAGIGSRLRSHIQTISKPLTLFAGKPIVQGLEEAMLRNHAYYDGKFSSISIGGYSELK